jgi:hypothetical protein
MQGLSQPGCSLHLRNGRSTFLSEVPCRVSSDVHERRTDLGAVSTADSVKLKWR